MPHCAYALAEIGASLTSGGRLYVRDAAASVIAHELGHNFGLAHSSGRQCDGAVEAGDCRTVGYRDYYDVMGVSWAQTGSLNVLQAAHLGVLPRAAVQRMTVTGGAADVTLAPVSGRSGVRALRLTDAAGVDYWLEYRPAAGRDAWLGTSDNRFALDTGLLLRRADRFPDTSVLLDGSPSRRSGWDGDMQAALAVGSPVSVSGGQFTIVLQDVTACRSGRAGRPDGARGRRGSAGPARRPTRARARCSRPTGRRRPPRRRPPAHPQRPRPVRPPRCRAPISPRSPAWPPRLSRPWPPRPTAPTGAAVGCSSRVRRPRSRGR